MARWSVALAASNWLKDQFAHFGSFATTSRSTLVSTRIIASVGTGQCKYFLRSHANRRPPPQSRKFALARLAAACRGAQRDLAAIESRKGHRLTGFEPKVVSDLLGNRDLPFAGEICGHESLTFVSRYYFSNFCTSCHAPEGPHFYIFS